MVGHLNCSQLKIQWVTGNMNSLGLSRTQDKAWKVYCTHFFKTYFVWILEFCTMIWLEQKAEQPELGCQRLLRTANPHEIWEQNKRQGSLVASSSSQEGWAGACLCWEGNTRCQVPRQLRGEWSWRCSSAFPLPPLPASVWAAPGTRNPSDVTCPARPSGTACRHKQGPAQPAWHLGAPGTVSRARQRDRHFRHWVLQGHKDASIQWERKGLHILTLGQLVNYQQQEQEQADFSSLTKCKAGEVCFPLRHLH